MPSCLTPQRTRARGGQQRAAEEPGRCPALFCVDGGDALLRRPDVRDERLDPLRGPRVAREVAPRWAEVGPHPVILPPGWPTCLQGRDTYVSNIREMIWTRSLRDFGEQGRADNYGPIWTAGILQRIRRSSP